MVLNAVLFRTYCSEHGLRFNAIVTYLYIASTIFNRLELRPGHLPLFILFVGPSFTADLAVQSQRVDSSTSHEDDNVIR